MKDEKAVKCSLVGTMNMCGSEKSLSCATTSLCTVKAGHVRSKSLTDIKINLISRSDEAKTETVKDKGTGNEATWKVNYKSSNLYL